MAKKKGKKGGKNANQAEEPQEDEVVQETQAEEPQVEKKEEGTSVAQEIQEEVEEVKEVKEEVQAEEEFQEENKEEEATKEEEEAKIPAEEETAQKATEEEEDERLRQQLEEEERAKSELEEQERIQKVVEERERLRKAQEEEERLQKVAEEERLAEEARERQEKEKLRLKLEEEERVRKEREEQEQQEQERLKREEEEKRAVWAQKEKEIQEEQKKEEQKEGSSADPLQTSGAAYINFGADIEENPWSKTSEASLPKKDAEDQAPLSDERPRNASVAIMPLENEESVPKEEEPAAKDDPFVDYQETGIRVFVVDAEEGRIGTPENIFFSHTLYKVQVNLLRPLEAFKNVQPTEFSLTRRYNHFESFYEQLKRVFPDIQLPALPEKNFFGRFDEETIKARMSGFNEVLHVISRNPTLAYSPSLLNFLELADKLGVKVEDPIEKEPSIVKRIEETVAEVLDFFVEGVDKTVDAITGVFKSKDEAGNERVLNQNQEGL